MESFLINIFGSELVAYIVMGALPLVFVLTYLMVAILGELKVSAWMQHRVGPWETGPMGILQPVADIVKLLQKESITPTRVDKFLFAMAPFMIFVGAYASFAVVPFSPLYIGADLDVGVFYVIAVSSLVVLGIFMGGWASNNKYTLYGGVRAVAQIISYEIPAGFIVLAVVMAAGTLSMQGIIEQQGGGFWNWFAFGGPKAVSTVSLVTGQTVATSGSPAGFLLLPVMLLAFLIYFVSSLAETNRTPFDLVEAESELVGGYTTEYGAMRYAFLFMAEYANMYVVAAIATTLFLGGWLPPMPKFLVQYFGASGKLLIGLEGLGWFLLKSLFLVFIQIVLRWTLPRFRVDQLMTLSWKMFLPIGFVIVIIIGAWVTFVNPTRQAVDRAALGAVRQPATSTVTGTILTTPAAPAQPDRGN